MQTHVVRGLIVLSVAGAGACGVGANVSGQLGATHTGDLTDPPAERVDGRLALTQACGQPSPTAAPYTFERTPYLQRVGAGSAELAWVSARPMPISPSSYLRSAGASWRTRWRRRTRARSSGRAPRNGWRRSVRSRPTRSIVTTSRREARSPSVSASGPRPRREAARPCASSRWAIPAAAATTDDAARSDGDGSVRFNASHRRHPLRRGHARRVRGAFLSGLRRLPQVLSGLSGQRQPRVRRR